jgi:hypothetical protein
MKETEYTLDNPILNGIVHRLVDAYQPERIYLFGSVARGEGGHVHGIVQRAFQRRKLWPVLRCKEHVGVEKDHWYADSLLQHTEETFGLSACEHAQTGIEVLCTKSKET